MASRMEICEMLSLAAHFPCTIFSPGASRPPMISSRNVAARLSFTNKRSRGTPMFLTPRNSVVPLYSASERLRGVTLAADELAGHATVGEDVCSRNTGAAIAQQEGH